MKPLLSVLYHTNNWISCRFHFGDPDFTSFYLKLATVHVTKALWMKGMVLWAYHIQAIHSHCPILKTYETSWATRNKNSDWWNFNRWKINVCKMKGLIVRPVICEHLCGLWRFPKSSKSSWWRCQWRSSIKTLSCYWLPLPMCSRGN